MDHQMHDSSAEQRSPNAISVGDALPYVNGPTMECAVFPISLSFNLSYWQNRKARIYLSGEQLINALGENVGEIPYFLVLQPPRNTRFKLDVAQREICVFNFDQAPIFFELQVWRIDGDQKQHFIPDKEPGPTMRLEKIGVHKGQVYCTIDCDKGLKVQKLCLVGIVRVGERLFISNETPFPPPSSKRRKPIDKPRGYSSAPYERRIKDDSGDNPYDDDDMPETPSSLYSSGRYTNGGTEGLPMNGLQSTDPSLPLGRRALPSINEPDIAAMWKKLEEAVTALYNEQAPVVMQQINLKMKEAASLEVKDIMHSQKELVGWLNSNGLTENQQPMLQQMMPTNITIEQKLIQCLVPCINRPWFYATISRPTAQKALEERFKKTSLPSFLVRISLNSRPFLALDAIYSDSRGKQQSYKALIKFEQESTGKLVFYLFTKNDSKLSRSLSLLDVVKYVQHTTGWSPMEPDLYDQIGLPQSVGLPQANMMPSSALQLGGIGSLGSQLGLQGLPLAPSQLPMMHLGGMPGIMPISAKTVGGTNQKGRLKVSAASDALQSSYPLHLLQQINHKHLWVGEEIYGPGMTPRF